MIRVPFLTFIFFSNSGEVTEDNFTGEVKKITSLVTEEDESRNVYKVVEYF